MRTFVIIEHDTTEALTKSALFADIMRLFMVDGEPLRVVEIGSADCETLRVKHVVEDE